MNTWSMRGIVIALLLGLFTVNMFAATPENVVIIAHTSVTDPVTKETLKQIFLGRQTRWRDDTKVTFVVLEESPVYEVFLRDYIEKTIFQYTNYWKKQVFTGKGRMPKAFATSAEVIEFVAATEGAISFVSPQAALPDTVHIVTIKE